MYSENVFDIGRLLLGAAREFSRQICDELDKREHPGLKTGHALLIANLDIEGTRISTLAERADISKQAMGQLVRELEGLGYLSRAADSVDGRAVRVVPTERGQKLLEDVALVARAIQARQAAKVGEPELQHLREILSKWLA